MAFEIKSKTLKWLIQMQVVTQADVKSTSTSTFEIK